MITIVYSIYSQSVHALALNAGSMDNHVGRYCNFKYLIYLIYTYLYLIFIFVFITFYIKDHYTIRMFNSIIIIKLFYNVIFLSITTLSQDMIMLIFLFYLYS